MNTSEMSKAAGNLIERERERFEEEIKTYAVAIEVLTSLIGTSDTAKLWRAVSAACDAEYELTGGDGPAGLYHDLLEIPECYEPGEPCAARSDDEYCRTKCPLAATVTDRTKT